MGKNKIEVVCLDLGDTLIKGKSWQNLNFAMGMTSDENAMLYNLHKNGEITYTMWVEIALGIYKKRKNLKWADVEKIINNYSYFPSAEELVRYLKQKYTVVIVSGEMNLVVEKIAKELGIVHFKSLTEFFFDELGYIAKVRVDDRTGDEAKNKVCFLKEICSSLGAKLDNCVCVGDGRNEHQLFKETRGITFDWSKEIHKKLAWKVVSDLSEIKNIL